MIEYGVRTKKTELRKERDIPNDEEKTDGGGGGGEGERERGRMDRH